MLGIDNGNDTVERVKGGNFVVSEESVGDWTRISHTSSLDNDGIKGLNLLVEVLEGDDEISADSAADTAIHNLNNLLVSLLRKNALINTDSPKLVLNHSKAQAMGAVVQDVVQKGGLATTKKTGEDGNRDTATTTSPFNLEDRRTGSQG